MVTTTVDQKTNELRVYCNNRLVFLASIPDEELSHKITEAIKLAEKSGRKKGYAELQEKIEQLF